MKLENTMIFENGIEHTFTEKELIIIKRLLRDAKVDEEYQKELDNLRSLFLEYLD